MLAPIAALAVLLMLSGCASSGDNSPSPSYQAGYNDAKSGTAASGVKAGLDFDDVCHSALSAANMFRTPSEGSAYNAQDFLRGCEDALCASDRPPNMFNPDYDAICTTRK